MNTIFNDIPERNINSIYYKIMSTVESLFGNRHHSFEFIGISLCDDAPCIYFPYGYNSGKVEIRITSDCEYNLIQAIFQTSHECVHLLYPNIFGASTYLEEGIATFFSHWYTNKYYGSISISNEKYLFASNAAISLFQTCPSLIKELRIIEPNISKITKEMILSYSPNLDETLVNALTTNFQSELPMIVSNK